jgi:hypothetical protein
MSPIHRSLNSFSDFPFDFINGISARFDTFPDALQSMSNPIITKRRRHFNEFPENPPAYTQYNLGKTMDSQLSGDLYAQAVVETIGNSRENKRGVVLIMTVRSL